MAETRSRSGEAVPMGPASHLKSPEEQLRTIELAGRQNLVDLVHRGRVRLHGEDGAIVELWEPVQVPDCDYKCRVRLDAHFSKGMQARYDTDEKPLPENPTCVLIAPAEVEVGSRICGNKSFSVDGWGLYNAQGERIRHHNRAFVLRDLSRIELLVPNDLGGADTSAAPMTLRNLGAQALLEEAIQATTE